MDKNPSLKRLKLEFRRITSPATSLFFPTNWVEKNKLPELPYSTTKELIQYLQTCIEDGWPVDGEFILTEPTLQSGFQGQVAVFWVMVKDKNGSNNKQYWLCGKKIDISPKQAGISTSDAFTEDDYLWVIKRHREENAHTVSDRVHPSSNIQRLVWSLTAGNTCIFYSRYEEYGDLSQYVEYIQEQFQRATPEVLACLFTLLKQLFGAFDFLHNTNFKDKTDTLHPGIIHNDIKPNNIFVGRNGVVVGDFGCSYFADQTRPRSGAIAYGAPEWFCHVEHCVQQLVQETMTEPHKLLEVKKIKQCLVDPGKADVWSLGVTLHALLNGGSLPPKETNDRVLPDCLPNNVDSELQLLAWAKAYPKSKQAQEAQEAKKKLKKLYYKGKDKDLESRVMRSDIIKWHMQVMLLPVQQRPTSNVLLRGLLMCQHFFVRCESYELGQFFNRALSARSHADPSVSAFKH